MKILNEKPPEWIMTGCLSQFRVNVERTFWTYGDTIYNPGGLELPDHIIAHEETHQRQQFAYEEEVEGGARGGADAWWKRYLTDPRFRMEQEAEAYGKQYAFFCSRVRDRNARARFLFELTSQLSGPLYQVAVSREQAKALILVLSGQKKLESVA